MKRKIGATTWVRQWSNLLWRSTNYIRTFEQRSLNWDLKGWIKMTDIEVEFVIFGLKNICVCMYTRIKMLGFLEEIKRKSDRFAVFPLGVLERFDASDVEKRCWNCHVVNIVLEMLLKLLQLQPNGQWMLLEYIGVSCIKSFNFPHKMESKRVR